MSSTSDPDALADLVRGALARCTSPKLLVARLTTADAPVPRRVDAHLPAHARRFGRHLAATSQARLLPQG